MRVLIFAAAAALTASPVAAQTAVSGVAAPTTPQAFVTVGKTVKGAAGNLVGTVASIDAGLATVDMGDRIVRMPLTSFGDRGDHLLISLTEDQLRAAAAPKPAGMTMAQATPSTAAVNAQAAQSTAAAAQAGQKVVPDRTPRNPANNVQGIASATGAQMQARDATQNAPGAMPGVAGVVAGKAVQDTAGNPVGVIEAVENDLAVLATDSAKVRIPTGSFADRNGVLVIAMTKEQVNQAATRAPGTAPTSN